MKKIIALLMVLAMALAVCACSAPAPATEETTTTTEETTAPEQTAETAEAKTYKIGVAIYQFDDNFMTLYRNELQSYMESLQTDNVKYDITIKGTVNLCLNGQTINGKITIGSGATLTLTGEQAVTLVRRRMDVADGTNETRMTRQREFMDAAVPLIREKINESSGFITTMIDTLTPYVTTNMVRGRMINEINRAYHYEVEPVQYLSGEHSIGEDGFVEFHADEQSIVDFVLDAFYTKKE